VCPDPQIPVAIVQNRLHAPFGKPVCLCGRQWREFIGMLGVDMIEASLGSYPQAAFAVSGN
jgi:hypothetical protein